MLQSFGLVTATLWFFVFSAMAGSASAATPVAPAANRTCSDWKEAQPVIQHLKKVAACGPQYTAKECRDNIGLGGAVGAAALAGKSVGALAGRNIQLKPPTVCGIALNPRIFLFESTAFASCSPQVKDGAHSVAQALKISNEIRDAELGNYLTQKLATENPKLDQLSRKVMSSFNATDASLSSKLVALNEELKDVGVKVTGLGQCTGDADVCLKLWSLAYAKSPTDQKAKVAANSARLMKFYAYDPEVASYKDKVNSAENLLRRVTTGAVVNEAQLEDLFLQAEKVTHPAAKTALSQSANLISRILPSLAKKSAFSEAGNLAKVSGEYLARNGKVLGKILPFGLASLVGVATGASAAEVGVDLLPPIYKIGAPISTGCSTLYSKYTPLDPDSKECRSVEKLTPLVIDFLTLSESEQQNEICSSSNLFQTLKKINLQYDPPGTSLLCGGSADASQITVKSDFQDSPFFAQFNYQGDNLVQAHVSKRLPGLTGYEFNLQSDTGEISSGKLISSRASTAIKKGVPWEKLNGTAEDFSGRQVLANMGRDCCLNGSSDSCSVFKGGVQKNDLSQTSGPGTGKVEKAAK